MIEFPFYFIGREVRVDLTGAEGLLHYAVVRMESHERELNLEIVETSMTFTPFGFFPVNLRGRIGPQGKVQITDPTGVFEGRGDFVGSSKGISAIRFEEGFSRSTKEKFQGACLFTSSGVRAMKTWYDAPVFGKPDVKPKYFSYQEGRYILSADFQLLYQDARAIPSYWTTHQHKK